MPTYDYACDACGHAFEREQRITEDAIKKCPKCGKQKARRMISGGGFILKGGGWESDLYSGASNRKSSAPGRRRQPRQQLVLGRLSA
ncbi:MAG: zinc ribbon domain-containing protein [Sandaracinaceae bacterium]|nr:zinc ribbon domain-containing protein [Sandaracinaceae bacterium]